MQQNQIVSTKTLSFPIATVWNAYASENLIRTWWGPHGFTNTFEKFEFQEGGEWIFTMISADGIEFPNIIIFKEIVPEKRIFLEHIPAPHFFAEIDFTSEGEMTHILFTMTFDSIEQCEAVKKYALNGNEENFERLEALLEKIS